MLFREANKKPADGTPPDGPKSRKMHLGEFVEKYARLPSSPYYPRGMKGGRSPLSTPFFHIFRRATKDMVPEGRKKSREARKPAKSQT